jgi:hypothetical protein
MPIITNMKKLGDDPRNLKEQTISKPKRQYRGKDCMDYDMNDLIVMAKTLTVLFVMIMEIAIILPSNLVIASSEDSGGEEWQVLKQ